MVLPKQESTSSTEKFDNLSEEELEQEYALNLANGKKNFLCGDFPEAITCFQNACYLRSEQFGDTSHECAEAFFYYGKSLLELARLENTVLGNALKGVPVHEPEESDSETDEQFEKTKNIPTKEREQLREEVESAMATEEEESMEEESISDDTKTAEETDEGNKESESSSKQDEDAPAEKDSKANKDEQKTDITETAQEDKQNTNTEVKPTANEPKPTEDEPKTDDTETAEAKMDDAGEVESKQEATKEVKSEEEPSGGSEIKPGADDAQEKATTDEPSCSEPCSSKGAGSSAGAAGAEGEVIQEDPDDIPNMQLAWEMIELAKVLYSKKPESESTSLLIAQCHSKLGELGLEVESYDQSVGDFNECLKIYEKYLSNSDRRLAETHYNLGLAYYFKKDFDSSLKHYRSANQVLEQRIEFLEDEIDTKGDKDDSKVMGECSEIGEIKNLIPDINSKIEDVLLMKRREMRLSGMGECSSSPFAGSSATTLQSRKPTEQGATTSSSSTQATNDISHLIRRKRPNTENELSSSASAENLPASKKLKEEKVSELKGAPEASKIDESEKENVKIATETA